MVAQKKNPFLGKHACLFFFLTCGIVEQLAKNCSSKVWKNNKHVAYILWMMTNLVKQKEL